VSSCDPMTSDDATEMFLLYKSALKAIKGGQSYTIDGRSLTRADLADVSKQFQYWRGQVERLCLTGNGGPTVRRVIPHG